MATNCIVLCKPSLENIYKKIESDDITTSSIIDSLNLENSILYIVTPSYQLLLQPDQKPVKEYPELLQKETFRPHKRPEYYLLIKDSTTKYEEVTLFIYLRFNFSIPPIAFPVSFNLNEMESTKTLFLFFQYQITFEYKSIEFFVNDNQKLDECPIDELIELLRYNYLSCKVQVFEGSPFLKQLKERTELVKSFFESECQFITSISQLAFYWQPLMLKNQLLDKDSANHVFSSFNSTVAAHNMFLLEYQQEMDKNQNIIDTFCDFQYFFNQTENLFKNYSTLDCFFKNKIKYYDFQTKLDNIVKQSANKSRESFFYLFFLPISRLNDFSDFVSKIAPLTPSFHADYIYIEKAKEICKNYISKIKSFLVVKPTVFNEICDIEERILNRAQFDLLSPCRSLLSAFKGKIGHGISNQGYIYIFNDIVFITKIARKGEMGKYLEYCYNFRYLTDKNTIYICKNEREFIQFIFLDETNFNFAIQQIVDQKTLYYSKMNLLNNIIVWSCVDSSFSFTLNACSCGTIVDNFMYLIGGYNYGQKFANNVLVYNIKNNQLKTIYNPLPGRKFHAITELNGIIYIFGGIGSDSHTVLGDFVTLDTNSSDSSMQKRNPQNLPCARYGHSLVSTNDSQLLVFGGIDRNKKFLGDFYICACYSNFFYNWKRIDDPKAPSARSFHSSVVMNGRYMILYGGIFEKKVLGDVAIFDIENKKWITPTLKGDLIVPRYMHRAVMYGNWMIVIGGSSNDTNEYLQPFGIMFEIEEDEKFVGTVANFTSGGNDRPNLSNFSIDVYNDEIIIIGGYDKFQDNASHGVFKLTLPKVVYDSAQVQAKPKQNRQTAVRRQIATKKSDPSFISAYILEKENKNDEKESKNPFLTKSYYSQFQKQEKTGNKTKIDLNENDSSVLKNFDSLSSIKIELPLDFSQITPKQAPSSYSKPFAMFDSLLPIVSCSKKKEGLYTFPFKGDRAEISTTKNITEKKKEEPEPKQFHSSMPELPPKLEDDDDDYKSPEKNSTTKEETDKSMYQHNSLMAMMPPKLDSMFNDDDDDNSDK